MKNKKFVIIFSLLFIFIFFFLFLNFKNGPINSFQHEEKNFLISYVDVNSEESEDFKDVSLKLISSEVILKENDYFLLVNLELTNNLLESINELSLQLRLYNELELDKALKIIEGEKTIILKIYQTNQYVGIDKYLFANNSSLNKFEKGVHFIKIYFKLPPPDSSEDFLRSGLISNSPWLKGNYNVDKADLFFYINEEQIDKIPIELGDIYEKDIRIQLLGLNWSFEEDRAYLNYISLKLLNPKENLLSDLKLSIENTNNPDKNQINILIKGNITLKNESNIYLIPEERMFLYIDARNKSEILKIKLLKDGEILDQIYVLKEKMVYLEKKIFLEKGFSINYKNYYPSKEEIELVINKGDIPLNNPLIEVICGRNFNYNLDIEDYGKRFIIHLEKDFKCIKPIFRLRDGFYSEVYAESTPGKDLWINLEKPDSNK